MDNPNEPDLKWLEDGLVQMSALLLGTFLLLFQSVWNLGLAVAKFLVDLYGSDQSNTK